MAVSLFCSNRWQYRSDAAERNGLLRSTENAPSQVKKR
jgi:hypothetical protein